MEKDGDILMYTQSGDSLGLGLTELHDLNDWSQGINSKKLW